MTHGKPRGIAASTPQARKGKRTRARDQADDTRPLTPEEGAQVLAIMREDDRRRAEAEAAAARESYRQGRDAVSAVRIAAQAGAESLIDRHVRTVAALQVMAERVPDDGWCDFALEARSLSLGQLASVPALSGRDVSRKLAVLVGEILRTSEHPELAVLSLAASALADAVTLDAGPIALPLIVTAPATPPEGAGV